MIERLPGASQGSVPMVFIHGWGCDNRVWEPLRQHLPGIHYSLTLPGFGDQEFVGNRAEFLQVAGAELPANCVLIGWSLGGMVATQLAADNPSKVVALVTLACNPSFIVRPQWPHAMAVSVYEQFKRQFDEAPVKTWMRFCALQVQGDPQSKVVARQLRQMPPPRIELHELWQQCLTWLAELDNRAILPTLSGESLHLFGDNDSLVPVAVAQDFLEWPKAHALTAPEVAHCLPLAAPEWVAAAIKEFLLQRAAPIDKQKIAESFGKAASSYDEAAKVQLEVGTRLLEWLPPLSPSAHVLDLGCGTGFFTRQLLSRSQPLPTLWHADLAEGMVCYAKASLSDQVPTAQWIVADAEAMPFAAASLEGVVSNMALQWCRDLQSMAEGVHRALKPSGWFLFSTLAPDTLKELRWAWQQLDSYVHVNQFHQPEDMQSTLQSAGFVVEQQLRASTIAEYTDLRTLLKALKSIGAHNMNAGQNPGLTSVGQWQRLVQAYESHRNAKGLLPATYDVCYFLVRKADE